MSEEIVVKPVEPVDLLTPEEAKAYRLYMKKGDPPLAPGIQAELFSLYLNGTPCEDIARLNPNFSLGMIVRARIEGLWDARRDAHIRSLFENVRERVAQVQAESIMLTADMLAAANKQFGDKLKRFIQTGDESVLGDLKIDSLKQYRDAVALLMQLTGQDKKVQVSGEVTKTVEFKGKLDAKQAAALLKLADEDK